MIPASPGLASAGADQVELRRRRRAHLPRSYDAGFDLALQVEQVCNSLAARVMLRPSPGFYIDEVGELADAVHFAACRLTMMIERAAAGPRTRHLPLEERERALRRIARGATSPAAHTRIAQGSVQNPAGYPVQRCHDCQSSRARRLLPTAYSSRERNRNDHELAPLHRRP
jgi:hypothetical protein